MQAAIGTVWGAGCAAAGVLLLFLAWHASAAAQDRRRLALAWALLATGTGGWMLAGAGWDKAVAFAAVAPSLVAFAVLGARAPAAFAGSRPGRRRDAAPAVSPARLSRLLARTVCAGPLALACALACAACVDLHAPGSSVDRLVAAGFVTPLAWAAAGVWATTDPRLPRAAAGLAALTAGAAATAML